MGREFELKFRASEAVQQAIAKKYGPWQQIVMETTYYDTPEGVLAAAHITLRRRMENGRSICTVKTPLPDGSRGEWETEWNEPQSMVVALCAAGAPRKLQEMTCGGIEAVCGAKFTRSAAVIKGENWSVELALDRGVLIGGGKQIPLCEVEVEHKSGEDAATLEFARQLAEAFALKAEPKSKFRRAQELTVTGESYGI